MTNATLVLARECGNIAEALGSVMAMAGDEPTYIPLEDFMSAEAIKAGPGDFDVTDLIFEDEFREEMK